MTIFTLMKKDMLLVLSDKKALSILLLMPVIITTILTMALSGVYEGNMAMAPVKVAVVKSYGQENAFEPLAGKFTALGVEGISGDGGSFGDVDPESWFFKDFLDQDTVKKIITYEVASEEDAMKALAEDKISAVVILPENYVESALINVMTPFRSDVAITVIPNPKETVGPKVVEALMTAYTEGLSGMTHATRMWMKEAILSGDGKAFDEAFVSRMKSEMEIVIDRYWNAVSIESIEGGAMAENAEVKWDEPLGRPALTSGMAMSLGMMAMFALFSAGYGSHFLFEDQKHGTLDRILAAGVKPMEVLLGNAGAVFVITTLQLFALTAYGRFALGVDHGDYRLFLIAIVIYAFSISMFSVFFGTIAHSMKSDKLPRMLQGFVFQVMALVGGNYLPVELMPAAFKWVSLVPLNGAFMKLGTRVARDYGFQDNLWLMGNLLIQAMIFGALAIWIFNREVKRLEDVTAT